MPLWETFRSNDSHSSSPGVRVQTVQEAEEYTAGYSDDKMTCKSYMVVPTGGYLEARRCCAMSIRTSNPSMCDGIKICQYSDECSTFTTFEV